jgi:hypothetical protein
MTIQSKRKPFGNEVIQAHRLMKNSINNDKYILLSKELSDSIHLGSEYQSKLYQLNTGQDTYDGKDVNYLYSEIDSDNLKLVAFNQGETMTFDTSPSLVIKKHFPVSAASLMEYVTNFLIVIIGLKGLMNCIIMSMK